MPKVLRIFTPVWLLAALAASSYSQTATFVTLDTNTKGNWKGKYGSDGYSLSGDGLKNPAYVIPTVSSLQTTWTGSTTDIRALQRVIGTDRLASTWFGQPTFTIDLNFSDALMHQVAIYCLDWDNFGPRSQTVEILDANNNVLDKRTISNFQGGVYLVWNLSGRVRIRATALTTNSVIEGIFFGGVGGTGATATFVKVDTTTKGNWKSAYGLEGYSLSGDGVKNPSYVIPTVTSLQTTWTGSTTDIRALQRVIGTDRHASTWFGQPTFTIDLNFSDSLMHQVAIYCLDWDNFGPRSQTVEILDANNNVLDKRTLSNFQGGVYVVWNLSGKVRIRATALTTNSVIEGIFFGGVAGTGATATFVKVDSTTQGNWKSAYGLEGYSLSGDGVKNPSYVIPAVISNQHTWAPSTTEARALQKVNGTDRIAGTWFGEPTFTIDLNFTDSLTHQVAIYCLDWDSYGPRSQTVEILDASNNVLDKRTINSFQGGVYLIWNLSGRVRIRATALTTNSVIEGIFFGGAGGTGATAAFVKVDTATKGNWKSAYGLEGYSLSGDGVKNPSYVIPTVKSLQTTWASSTTDIRALQRVNGTDRIAATWFGEPTFTIDLNFTDSQMHQVAIYCLDWDSYGPRSQKIEILDSNNSVLDTRTISNFQGGQYLVWNLSGKVKIRATALTTNSVIEGIFFGAGGASIDPVTQLPIPQLQTWESNMKIQGARFCIESEINQAINASGVFSESNVWYYDGARVYSQIATYTNDPWWLTCAGYANNAYRSFILAITEGRDYPMGPIGGWRVFPHGLLADYQRVGSIPSKTAIQRLAKYSPFAPSGGHPACEISRETAYVINAYLGAEAVGEPRNPLLATAVNYALGHIDQWFVSKSCTNLVPFMVGLTLEALISYYEVTGDSRIPPAVALATEELWNRAWLPASKSFYYDTATSTTPTVDVNLLMAPSYAWLWQLTGEKKHQERGDLMFGEGVVGTYFWSGKHFSMNYRLSFNYVKWRGTAARTLPLTVIR